MLPLESHPFRLLDGPLLDPRARRENVVRRMADDLVALGVTGDKPDVIRALLSQGYPSFDVARLWEDARQVAVQAAVAREMSAP